MSHKETEPQESRRASSDEAALATPPVKEWTLRSTATVIGAFLSLFISVGFVNAYGIFQSYFQTHQLKEKSAFDIAWIGSFMTFILFVGGAPAGILVDKVGPKPLVGGGSIGLLLSMFMTSLCEEYYQFFLAQGLLMGLSMAFLTIPVVATLSKHFIKNRGLVTGIAIGGSSLGGVIWPIVCDQLLNHHSVSYGWTMRINGFIMIPISIIIVLTVDGPRTPKPPKSEVGEAEKSAGETEKTAKPKQKMDLSIVKNPTFILFVIGLAFFNLGMFTPFFFVTSYSAELGLGVSFSFYVLSIMNAASLFGRIGGGALADKFGPYNLISIMALLGAVTCYCWTTATSTAGITVWSLAYGFSSGAILSLQLQCAAAVSTPETFGTAMGMAFGAVSITGLVGTPISGELQPKGFLALSLFAASTLMAGSVFLILARLRLSKKLLAAV